MRLIFFLLLAGAGTQAFATDPVIGVDYTFASCTPGTILNSSATGTTTYVFPSGSCAGYGFTATCINTGASPTSPARVLLSSSVGVNTLRFDRGGSTSNFTGAILQSSSGAKFQLTNLLVLPVNAGTQTITITGYASGVAVPGAVATINYVTSTPIHTTTLTSASLGVGFNNIDEITITTNLIYGVAISDIQTATPVPLPLTLTDFSGQRSGDDVLLQWTTASEQNTSHFDIQRGTDGIDYTSLATVAAADNSNIQLNYSYTDPLPANAAAQYFYRLRMVDLDGSFTYSPILRITGATPTPAIQVYPNPFSNQTQLVLNSPSAGTAQLTVTDMTGRLLLTGNLPVPQGNTVIPVPMLATLPKGVYALRVVFDGTGTSKLIVKTQ
jgi:hypothetical protein